MYQGRIQDFARGGGGALATGGLDVYVKPSIYGAPEAHCTLNFKFWSQLGGGGA